LDYKLVLRTFFCWNPVHWRRKEFESGAHACPKRSAGIFFVVSSFFGSSSTISRFGERFRDG